jgi:serine/arginine repetitive matrix protein 2
MHNNAKIPIMIFVLCFRIIMYNGIGLQTVRGSGTNGYVQRNMGFVRNVKDKVNYKTEEEIKRAEALAHKEPNQGIMDHERKRKLEVSC